MAEQAKEARQNKSAVQDSITALLKTDAQAAMAMMVEEYTALIWRVAEQHLKNPEDIKECVNDTFLQFFLHQDRYAPGKGTLPTFLAAIARNLAIDRYRKNQIRSSKPLTDDIPVNTDDIQNANEKIDLERALATLKPEDAEIIRMKYYDGMTVQEIAESLHLPYETVKKRHQRGLGKMRLALIVSLILLMALLAACAYIVLHYFEIIPGFGVINTSGISVYMLEDPVTAEDSAGIYTIYGGYLVDDKIMLQGRVHFKSEDSSEWVLPKDPDVPYVLAMLRHGENMFPGLMSWDSFTTRDGEFMCGTSGAAFETGQDGVSVTLILGNLEFPLEFRPAKLDGVEEYNYELGEKGGIMAFPRWSEGCLVVDVYPLNVEGYTICSGLVTGFWTLENQDQDVVKLIEEGEEGPTGQQEYFSGIYMQGLVNIHSWNFGPVEPGSYTLHIPYLILEQPVEEPPAIPIDLTACSWEEQEYHFPGARIRMVDCQRVETVPGEPVLDTQECAREGFSYWLISMDYQEIWEGGDDYRVMSCYPSVKCEWPDSEEGFFAEHGSTSQKEGNIYRLLFWMQDSGCDSAHVAITTENLKTLKWEHSFDIPIVVSADEK